MHRILSTFVFLLPASRFKNYILNRLGHGIGQGARIGPNLVLDCESIRVGPHGSVGAFNVIRGLIQLEVHESASIGHWNWLTAAKGYTVAGGRASLILREGAALTARHYLDASGGIEIGRFTTIAGARSAFWTHGIKWGPSQQHVSGIAIGAYCLIGANALIAPGTTIADRCVVGMGTVLAGRYGTEGKLLLSPRAAPVADVSGEYFERTTRFVDFPEGS